MPTISYVPVAAVLRRSFECARDETYMTRAPGARNWLVSIRLIGESVARAAIVSLQLYEQCQAS